MPDHGADAGQLRAGDRTRHLTEAVVAAGETDDLGGSGRAVFVAIQADVAHAHGALVEPAVCRNDHSALTGGDDLALLETVAGDLAQRADQPAVIGGAEA